MCILGSVGLFATGFSVAVMYKKCISNICTPEVNVVSDGATKIIVSLLPLAFCYVVSFNLRPVSSPRIRFPSSFISLSSFPLPHFASSRWPLIFLALKVSR